MRVEFLLGLVGGAILAYAAYCTIQYRAVLKIREEEFAGPPAEVLLEVIIGLVLCFWAALSVPGKYLPILPDSKENRLVSLPENLDFMIFNHRGN
ncbi:hypothetical protein SUGI_1037080 [Cryptomeria japonica]|nr:hypothetical protein SUGI_1037080 [Cryptomeria japonica]